MPESKTQPKARVNLRTPEVMSLVQAQVEAHYRSTVVEKIRGLGGLFTIGPVSVRLAREFGFCYGVERAIDLAYAARKVFQEDRIFILGEIIHNPEVNEQLRSMGIRNLMGPSREAALDDLLASDVVIVPAFGAEVEMVKKIKAAGCRIVDTTCGDVMSVWKRVRQNSRDQVTSIIHGKATHEETRATSSHAVGDGTGHYLVVLNLTETNYICDYIRKGGDRAAFLEKFKGAHSTGFDPDLHLRTVGVANQTTMLRGETEEVQRRIRLAIAERDGNDNERNYRFFDTICGATQERQDALQRMLDQPMDLLLVIGGYNSSNTSHLAEMGESVLPTFFVRNASKLVSATDIEHYDQHRKEEIRTENWLPMDRAITVGVTAGASCPNNLIEETILRVFDLRGISPEQIAAG